MEWEKENPNGTPDELHIETKAQEKKVKYATKDHKVDILQEILHKRCPRVKPIGVWSKLPLTNKIDIIALVIFIFTYFIFNCAYWFRYIQGYTESFKR